MVSVYRAHRGAGRNESVDAYIYAEDAIVVLKRYKTMPGIKRNPRRNNFPNITPLSLEESITLEQDIVKEGRISLEKARKTWYYTELI